MPRANFIALLLHEHWPRLQKAVQSAHWQSKSDQVNGPCLGDQPFKVGAADEWNEPQTVNLIFSLRALAALWPAALRKLPAAWQK